MAIYFLKTRKLGTFKFDSVVTEDHDESVRLTQNPVQQGYIKTDHAVVDPIQLTIRGRVQDWAVNPLSVVGDDFAVSEGYFGFGDSASRSQAAYSTIRSIMRLREPIEVETGMGVFKNMIILNISTTVDKDTSQILDATINLEEILLTSNLESVQPADPQDSGSTLVEGSKGNTVPAAAMSSILTGGLLLYSLRL